MGIWAELRRRNVIRVGVAYLVGAWLLLQVTDVLTSLLGLPPVTGRMVFAVLVIGFVPALVFAWAYQLTPEGLKRDTGGAGASVQTARNLDRAVIAMLAAVAALVVVDRLLPRGDLGPGNVGPGNVGSESNLREGGAIQEAPAGDLTLTPGLPTPGLPAGDLTLAPGLPDARPSIAVLPFANMSADAENEYFSDGISEELLNLLVRVEGLRVPSRTSSFAYKGMNKDIREIARELEVNHILEGSVRKAGSQVRITAQLIDTSTDTHLWSQTWDRELEDIFAIQEEIANHIVEALKGVLDGGPIEHRPTQDLEAYTLFLEGRHLFQRRGEGLANAEQLLRRAVELDPQFAEAWATLAVTLSVMPNYLSMPTEVAMPRAREAAERALQLQPSNTEALLALSQAERNAMNFAASFRLLEQAVASEPDNALARLWLAIALIGAGYMEQAATHLQRAVDMEPNSAVALDWYARSLVAQGRLDEAMAFAERAIRLGRPQAWVPVMQATLVSRDATIARSRLHLTDESGVRQAEFVISIRENPARLPEGLAYADQVAANEDPLDADYLRMSFYMAANDAPGFFAALRTIQAFDDSATTIAWAPQAAAMRGSEEMQEWIRYLGLDAVWAERGAPDYCVPDNGGWRCE